MKKYYLATKKFVYAHKVWSGVLAAVILFGGYYTYGKLTSTTGETRYVLGEVSRGTVVSIVSGSGQVAADQQLDIKPKVSGEVVYVGVKPGQTVRAGTLLLEIDPTDAQKQVRDAQASLQSAQISLAKLQEPADALSQTQAQNNYQNAQDSLARDYTNVQSDVTSTFLDLPDLMSTLQDGVTGTETNRSGQWNIDFYKNALAPYDLTRATSYRDDAYAQYIAAKASYDQTFADYKATNLNSADTATTEKLLAEAYATVQLAAASAKSSSSLVQFYEDTLKNDGKTPPTAADTQLTNIAAAVSKINTHASTLLSDKNTLKTDKQQVVTTSQSLDKLKAGADSLDLQSSQLSVTRAQNALQDAQENLADYFVRAPFDGTVASVAVNKYDTASGVVATLITPQKLATLSFNEVDAAKIQNGQKVTLTFDAIDGLQLTGTVAQIDPTGTVAQGVVSYAAKISFDAQNQAIKTGMTVNADIQTAVHQDTLVVPSSAVKTINGSSYVLAFTPPLATSTTSTTGIISSTPPTQIPVEVGISDDTSTEILSGLTEGQQVVVRTIAGTATTAASATTRTTGGAAGARGGAGGTAAIRL